MDDSNSTTDENVALYVHRARVLFTGTSYPTDRTDWRGLFLRHLLHALAKRMDFSFDAWLPPGEIPSNVHRVTSPDDEARLAKLLRSGGIAHQLRTSPLRGILSAFALLRSQRRACSECRAHLYHMNWLQNALSAPRDGRPMLVTALGSDLSLARIPIMKTLLRRAFRGRAVAICPNAEWMIQPLSTIFGDVARICHVPFGIDPDWFRIARAKSNGSPHLWLCVSRLTSAKLGPLLDWSEPYFEQTGRELHLFGPMQESIAIPHWVKYHGPANQQDLRKNWFPRATGLVTLSRHSEGRPQVMLEAMAAGLPILASDMPAHSDFIEHEKTGWLCGDERAFQDGLLAIENTSIGALLGENARDWAQREVGSWEDCAARYAVIYHSLLEGEMSK